MLNDLLDDLQSQKCHAIIFVNMCYLAVEKVPNMEDVSVFESLH